MTWATSVPILVFLGHFFHDLGLMYATDRQTPDSIVVKWPRPLGGCIIMRGHRVMNFVTLTSRPTACETDGTGGLKDSRPNCNRLNLSTCKRQHLATTDDAHTHTHTHTHSCQSQKMSYVRPPLCRVMIKYQRYHGIVGARCDFSTHLISIIILSSSAHGAFVGSFARWRAYF